MSVDQRSVDGILRKLATDLKATRKIGGIFGIAGDPITPLITHIEALGIQYFGFRNEQAASYAASAVSFLSRGKQIGICLSVAGPGMINALTGSANAKANNWPMLLICPFTPSPGDFQYIDQLEAVNGLAKSGLFYDGQAGSVNKALELAYAAPSGGVVLFVTKDLSSIPRYYISSPYIRIQSNDLPEIDPNSNVLMVIGAGMIQQPSSDQALLRVVENFGIPFVADPMARGIIPESHPLCVTAARSTAFKTACTVIVAASKLDWMMGYGKEPKWRNDCRFLMFSNPDYTCTPPEVQERVFYSTLDDLSKLEKISVNREWRDQVVAAAGENKAGSHVKLTSWRKGKLPSHSEAVGAIRQAIDELGLQNALIVSEGANTMDAARVALDRISMPGKRIDAGRWGTMGCGLGFVLAAHALNPNDPVICVQGDSAFGFSGMELETMVRYKCKGVILVFNNGGIYTGTGDNATSFNKGIKHEQLMEAFGGQGMSTANGDAFIVLETVRKALEFLKNGIYPILVDITIDPASGTMSGSLSRL